MTATIHYDDVSLEPLKGARVAVIGYGSQGRAHALNLRDSGLDVVVGLRKDSPTWERVEADGLTPVGLHEAASGARLVAMLVPDQHQAAVYVDAIEPNLEPRATLLFSHGFNIHFGQIRPPSDVDVVMIAPKAPGPLVRRTYEDGKGVPGLVAIHQDSTGSATDRALAYAKGIGCTRAGVIETTFAEETETDLFGEQAVLCGGTSRLIQAGYQTLVDAGYQPEIAYFECMHELKLIVDLLYEGGFTHMRDAISDTAEYGEMSRGPRIVTPQTKAEMKKILGEIKSGEFAKEWRAEYEGGMKNFKRLYEADNNHPVEVTGRRLRKMMPWLKAKEPPKG